MTSHICIDVGGTSTTVGIIINHQVVWSLSLKTESGINEFPIFFKDMIVNAQNEADRQSIQYSQTVIASLPGNFTPGDNITIKPGSARQLIKPMEDYNDLDFSKWLTQHLDSKIKVWGINDGASQAVGGMCQNWQRCKGKLILYIGPGTGLGGAVIQTGIEPHDMEFISDGHIYDIMIDDNQMAEDAISGQAVHKKCNHSAKAINMNQDLWDRYKTDIQLMANAIVQLINTMTSGSFTKKTTLNNWSKKDQQKMKGINVILLGGSIGTQGRMGALIKETLEQHVSIPIIQIDQPNIRALEGAKIKFEQSI